MSVTESLPRWDMNVVFPGLQSKEFKEAYLALGDSLKDLESLFDLHGVSNSGSTSFAAFDEILTSLNTASEDLRTVTAYVRAHTTTDSRDEEAAAWNSELDGQLVRMRKLAKSFAGWIGILDLPALLASSQIARDHEYALTKAKVSASYLMSAAEEALASDIEVTASSAWTKLHSNITSQLTVCLETAGKQTHSPMSLVRTMAYSPDRAVREKGYRAELETWKTVEVPLAAAMNSIKGTTIQLCAHRGWGDPLDEAVFNSNIDRETLTAMMTAATESFVDFRRYLNAKAKALGLKKLAFFDIFAPLGASQDHWEYGKACNFVIEQFQTYSDKLGDFAARAFRENWVDVEPRPGKTDGAFCMGLRRDESRILMNYKPAFGAVSTLAHELGHGYHNLCLYGRTATQRALPMTLAETASIFCETIIRQAVLESGTPEEQFSVLEASLQGSCQVVVDISSRFLFEQKVFEKRKQREVSPRELCDFMTEAQMSTYGDGLDESCLHPYMWAAKGHYYGASYYNYPYMFGLLFGLGLYAEYQKSPDSFRDSYDDLLSSTGLADAATLGQRFGIDTRSVDFWRASLDQIRLDIDRFEALVNTTKA